MPQTSLPFFPVEIELINNHIGFQKKAGIVYYFKGANSVDSKVYNLIYFIMEKNKQLDFSGHDIFVGLDTHLKS